MPLDAGIYRDQGQAPAAPFNPIQGLSQLGQIRAQQQQAQLRQQAIDEGAVKAQQVQQTFASTQHLNAIIGNPGLTREAMLEKVRTEAPDQYLTLSKHFEELDKSAADTQKLVADAKEAHSKAALGMQQHAAGIAAKVKAQDYNPAVFELGLKEQESAFPDTKPLMDQLRQQVLQAGPNGHAVIRQLTDAAIQAPIAAKGEQPTEASTAMSAAGGNPQAAAAMNLLKPPAATTGAAEDERYRKIQAAMKQGETIPPADAAWAGAYEKQKTLGVDASAAAATNRQTRTIQEQIDQQKRAQDFAQAQAGRAELTNKVEQPYLDAKEKASTLRSIVEAAKNGNMVAGSVTPLLAVLGLTTMEGVKRINSTELGQVSGAGSLLERIKGAASKLAVGQPMSAKLQDDITQLSTILESSARTKYLAGHGATTKRYGLTDEQPLAEPSAVQTSPGAGGVPFDYAAYQKSKQK